MLRWIKFVQRFRQIVNLLLMKIFMILVQSVEMLVACKIIKHSEIKETQIATKENKSDAR